MESWKPVCDLWLWDGAMEYEGAITKLEAGSFTAVVRHRSGASKGTGRRLATAVIDLQKTFVGKRFIAYCTRTSGDELQEAEVLAVQRSSSLHFELLFCGSLRPLDAAQKETLKHMSVHGAAALLGEARRRLGA